MKRLSLSSVTATSEGDFPTIEPGAYECAVQSVEDVPEREYFTMAVGVTSGLRKGFFDSPEFAARPWAHSLTMSYKDAALGMLKGRLERIGEANPGFDAVSAVEAGRIDMLVGRRCFVVFRAEEYYDKKAGEFRIGSPRPSMLCSPDDFRSGRYADPAPVMMRDARKRDAMRRAGCSEREISLALDSAAADAAVATFGSPAQAAYAYDDIPF